jgi:arabinan endo-1,5-alpha-L-arabinosidase
MAAGGGEVIAQRDDEYFGIGHTSAYKFDGQWYFMAHGYARANNGASKLVIKKMHFDKDGWPVLDEKVNGEK